MYKVGIIMSVYNGSIYLKEQLDSIFKQQGCDIHLFVRDDGSKDNSLEILYSQSKVNEGKITILKGDNKGFAESFMDVLMIAKDCDFYAFADQDDVWESNKLIKAIPHINNSKACLYGSNLLAFDQVENRKFYLYGQSEKDKYFRLIEKYYFYDTPYGCTMVWNKSLQTLLKNLSKPKDLAHDGWVDLIAKLYGYVYFDYDNSYINYRLHGNNASGATPKSVINKLKKYYKFYFANDKKLNLSLKCKTICALAPNKTNKIDYVLANYNKSFLSLLKALYEIVRSDLPNERKFKYTLLAIFHKL